MNAGQMCTREVVVVERDESLVTAAQLMREHHVGDVVVVETRGSARFPVGILTDRDIVVGPVAQDPQDIPRLTVGDVIAAKLITATENQSLIDVLDKMRSHGVRRIPVVDEPGGLVGILSTDDVVELIAEQLGGVAELFNRGRNRELKARP